MRLFKQANMLGGEFRSMLRRRQHVQHQYNWLFGHLGVSKGLWVLCLGG